MRYSDLFATARKKPPSGEKTLNARLLIRAGYVNKLAAGIYTYLPLGLRVIRKIEAIVREEIKAIGAQEILMPALHPADIWKKTGAWKTVEVLYKIASRTKKEYALGQSHEEVITPLVKEYISSYKDLPLFVFQIQTKFRDELRAKSGILRGREFNMKDMYSFHLDQDDFDRFYNIVKKTYLRIFSRCGLAAKTTEASGGNFSEKISYEFMVLAEAGEDDILYCPSCSYCVNAEIAKQKKGERCPSCAKKTLKLGRASEVGNVFDLGQKYSRDFNFYVLNDKGKKIYPIMGCYGIGISRLMGVVAEKYNDKNGLVWPEAVAPFKAHLLSIGKQGAVLIKAEQVYQDLQKKGIEVFFDDRQNISAGQKLAEADLIGIPHRLLVSAKTKTKVEYKKRGEAKTAVLSLKNILEILS